jgi:PAS domain S-box-containing protein
MLLTKLEERSVPRLLQPREVEQPVEPPSKTKKPMARFFLPKRLFFQTIFASTVLVTLAIVGYSAHVVRDEIEVGMERLVHDGIVLSKNIALAAAAQIENGSPKNTERLLLQSVGFEQVKQIDVTDVDGLLLHRAVNKADETPKLDNEQTRLAVPLNETQSIRMKNNTVVVWQQIGIEKKLGWVRVIFSTRGLHDLEARLRGDHFFDALIVALLTASVFLLLAYRPVKAIEKAAAFAADLPLRRGEKADIGGVGSLETEMLEDALNDASESLAAQEQELVNTASYLNSVLDCTIDAIIAIDGRGIIKTFNRSAEQVFGYPAEEILGLNVSILMGDEHRRNHDSYLRRYASTGRRTAVGRVRELTARRRDGTEFPIEINVGEIKTVDGPMFIGLIRDITLRQVAEKALKRSEERFRDFATTASDWYWETDADMRITHITDEFFNRFEAQPSDVIGTPYQDLVGQSDPDVRTQHLSEIEAREIFRDFRYSATSSDGKTVYLTMSGKPVFDETGTFQGYRGTAADVTQRTELESELAEARRMESLGKLTGGVAHEFNNLLAVIAGFAKLARKRPDKEDRVIDALETIIRTADQAELLTRQMLAFGRQEGMTPRIVALGEIIDETRDLLQPLMKDGIEIKYELSDNKYTVRSDPVHLAQAILNLGINARDAMPDGGTLIVSTGARQIMRQRQAGGRIMPPGRYVVIDVTDTGTGMDAQTMERIFEPFFTTKEVNKGTGLGLSTIYSLMEQLGGYIDVESSVGEGSTFSLYLPEVSAPISQQSSAAAIAAI